MGNRRFSRYLSVPCLLVCVLPIGAVAQDDQTFSVISSEGHSYTVTCTDNGFVLTSDYPTARIIENGVKSFVIKGVETIFLGKSCDASSESFGAGSWGAANGGFAIAFDRKRIAFPRQAPHCVVDGAMADVFAYDCPL